MNYQEKAKELFDKYFVSLLKSLEIKGYNLKLNDVLQTAKQCALIAVDEIITTLDLMELTETGVVTNCFGQGDWQQVRQEIELLKE